MKRYIRANDCGVRKLTARDKTDIQAMLRTFESNGTYSERGRWSISAGGYDADFELCIDCDDDGRNIHRVKFVVPLIRSVSGHLENVGGRYLDDATFKKIADIIISRYPDCYL